MSTSAEPARPGSWLTPQSRETPRSPETPQPPELAPAPAHRGPLERPAADVPAEGLGASLAGLPVSAHADVLAAEHDRLHRLLATIDQL